MRTFLLNLKQSWRDWRRRHQFLGEQHRNVYKVKLDG